LNKIIKKAGILVEALPYIRKFSGKIFLIKYGGSVMQNSKLEKSIMKDLILLKYVGINPVLIHGGGPEINKTMKIYKKEAKFINGLRITDKETIDIVEMVLVGKINKKIVTMINSQGAKSVGISGKDGNLIKAKKLYCKNEDLDLGYVGQIQKINPGLLYELIDNDYIPIVSPVGADDQGNSYNINADTVAGELAVSLKADKLIILTDVDGICFRPDEGNRNSIVSSLCTEEIKIWLKEEKIKGGMIPKAQACIDAVSNGVKRSHILNGKRLHALLLEIFTDQGIGTMIYEKELSNE